MIKNIVFDMGNVLIMFYPEKTLRKYLDNEDDIRLVMKEFYDSGAYRDVDRGVKTYEEVIDSVADKLPERLVKLLKQLYVDSCFGLHEMPVYSEMYDLIATLKKNGYGIYLLSNAGFDFYEYSRIIPAMNIMDGKIISCEYKVLKPEPEIYEILFDKFDLEPDECIFIDDVQENIDGGIKAGMTGICFSPAFEDVCVLKDKLRENDIDI